MSILIIGGAGYIGSHTVKYFLEQNEEQNGLFHRVVKINKVV